MNREPGPLPSGVPFGLVDLPAEQRQPVARHDPLRHGNLMVLGAPRSGKTTVLDTLAAAAPQALWLPGEPAALWDVLSAEPGRADGLLLLDDLDLVVARCDPDHRAELLDLLARRVREAGAGDGLVVTAHRLGGALSAFWAHFESRLILRQSSREDHIIAGAPPAEFDPRLPPGSGWWRGAVVQVAIAPTAVARRAVAPPPVVAVRPDPARELAVVAPRVAALRERLGAAGAHVVLVGEDPAQAAGLHTRVGNDSAIPRVLLGDPDAWQADWALLTRVRRDLPMLLDGCSLADHRALTRSRELPPPLDRAAGDCWLVEGGRTRRARLDLV